MDMRKQCEVWKRAFDIRGYSVTAACKDIGISPDIFWHWQRTGKLPNMSTVKKIDEWLDRTRPREEKDHAQ